MRSLEKKVDVEKLPPGICIGAIDTYPEKYLRDWKLYNINLRKTRVSYEQRRDRTCNKKM